MSKEMSYYERLRKKVERMEKEWIEYNMTDQLISDFFARAREELDDEGIYDAYDRQIVMGVKYFE